MKILKHELTLRVIKALDGRMDWLGSWLAEVEGEDDGTGVDEEVGQAVRGQRRHEHTAELRTNQRGQRQRQRAV